MSRVSPFIDTVAVEAWDAWFRWRDRTGLHDVSIEDTWRRVAKALASVESPREAPVRESRFFEAFATWQLLPDERLLAGAGAARPSWASGMLAASLNAAAFVSPPGARARINHAAVADCAALAVRMLDNALLLANTTAPRLHIGIIGMADALLLLGLGYDSGAGRDEADAFARALCAGCFRASVELAHERGASPSDTREALLRARRRDIGIGLVRDAGQSGLRHVSMTAVTSQPRLALLANVVSNALDPLRGEDHRWRIDTPDGAREMHSPGYALNMLRADGRGTSAPSDTLATLPWMAQISMRAAVQPWMDLPIAYPVHCTTMPDSRQHQEAGRIAAMHGLGAPVWLEPDRVLPA
jgi:ribonucleoside-diphosphate reductase alpha chain